MQSNDRFYLFPEDSINNVPGFLPLSFTGSCTLVYLLVSFYYDEGHQEPTMSRMSPSEFSKIHEGCVIQNQFLSFYKRQLPRFGVQFVGPITEKVNYSIQILA